MTLVARSRRIRATTWALRNRSSERTHTDRRRTRFPPRSREERRVGTLGHHTLREPLADRGHRAAERRVARDDRNGHVSARARPWWRDRRRRCRCAWRRRDRAGQDPQVEAERAVLDVPHVELQAGVPPDGVAPVDLGPPGDAGTDLQPSPLAVVVALDVPNGQRTRSDHRHVATRTLTSDGSSSMLVERSNRPSGVIRAPSASGAVSPGRIGRIERSLSSSIGTPSRPAGRAGRGPAGLRCLMAIAATRMTGDVITSAAPAIATSSDRRAARTARRSVTTGRGIPHRYAMCHCLRCGRKAISDGAAGPHVPGAAPLPDHVCVVVARRVPPAP